MTPALLRNLEVSLLEMRKQDFISEKMKPWSASLSKTSNIMLKSLFTFAINLKKHIFKGAENLHIDIVVK